MTWNRGVGHCRRGENTSEAESGHADRNSRPSGEFCVQSRKRGAQEHTGLGRRIWTAMGYYSRSQGRKVKEGDEGILQTSGLC